MPKKTRKRPEIRTATEEPPDAWFATPSELAEALDVTTRSLNGWARTKRFPKPSRGLYDLRVVLRWFRESLAEAKTSAKTQTARDRLDEIKAANAELDFLARAGRLVWRRDVIAIWQRHITTARVLIENLGEWVVNQLPDDARAGLLDGIRAQIRVATQTLEAGKNLSEASAHPDKEAIEEDDDEED